MSLTAAAIRALADKGLTAADIADVAEAMLVRADPTAAARQQRRRDKLAAERDASRRDITRDDFPNEETSNPLASPSETKFPSVKRGSKPSPFPCPDGVAAEHWRDFMANRKRKRSPSTATAYAGILRDLAKWSDDEWPPGRVLQHAAERGWAGIYDPRPKDDRNGHHRPEQSLRGSRPDPAVDLKRIAAAELAAEGAGEDQGADFGAGTALPSYLTN